MKNNNFNLQEIPSQCGVYLFKKDQEILYIGKAKNIKNRISQYLKGSKNSYKTPQLLNQANNLEFLICTNEREALLLEQELIKKYHPHYNVLLLDDKKYPYIVIELKNNSLEIKVRFNYRNQKNTFYFGPLPPSYGYKTIINFLIRETMFHNGLPIKTNDQNIWKNKFEYAKKILSSSNDQIINKLTKAMDDAAQNEQYELAKEIRDIIKYLSNKIESQSIIFKDQKPFDIIYFKKVNDYLMIQIHNFHNGLFFMNEEFIIEIKIDFDETIASFLNEFYTMRNLPNKIYTNIKVDQDQLIHHVEIIIPLKGKYYQALNNACANLEVNQRQKILAFTSKQNQLDQVQKFINQICNKNITNFIMIDNSHESDQDVVSSIIYYRNLLPIYSMYRKYKIEIKHQGDIYYLDKGLSIYLKNENIENLDLIIVDGGNQHIQQCQKTLKGFNFSLPIFGLVKDQKHITKYLLTSTNKKINIKENKNLYNFLANLQIEVDRYAKNYHQKVKINSSLEGFLSTIDGIGPKTEEKLLNEFKTYTNIYNASYEKLSSIVSKSIAKKIIEKTKK